jgi:hypothetical protein
MFCAGQVDDAVDMLPDAGHGFELFERDCAYWGED